MHIYYHIFGRQVNSYGTCIVLGLFAANLLAIWVMRRKKLDGNNLILLETIGGLCAILGAKLLFLLVSAPLIDWSRFFEPEYFVLLMQGGYVFYGGLVGGFLGLLLAGKLFQIPLMPYLTNLVFLVPLGHAFGRIGCFMAGCCYGIPYNGPGAVVFPESNPFTLSGVPLFPVQLAEACCLFLIFLILGYLTCFTDWEYPVESYMILYAIVRFSMEFLRFDAIRGAAFGLSTSQWISILMLGAGLISILRRSRLKAGARAGQDPERECPERELSERECPQRECPEGEET